VRQPEDADLLAVAVGVASAGVLLAVERDPDARDSAGVMDWPPGSHASTFGGNPVSCRAALATLDLLEESYMANATARGQQLREGLARLRERQATLGENRGLGLMQAIDIVHADTPKLDPKRRAAISQAAFHKGLLLLGCGASAIRFCPPLCISAEQVETMLRILEEVIG
jgi:4-aminobutyrate aminotransferase